MSLKLTTGVNNFLEQVDAPMASFFSSCVNCGLCAEACLFYTETGDPKYTPIHKLAPFKRLWKQNYTFVGRITKAIGISKKVTDDELEEWSELLYDSCTMCGRCTMVCPVGNDITYMIRKAREGMVASGHAPEDLISAAHTAVETGSPMGVKLQTLQAQLKHVKADTGIDVELDKQGADYMLLLSAMEVVNYPEFIGAVARIFKQAGVSWTIASEFFEATNVGIQIGSADIARNLVSRAVNAAEKLEVKNVISPECGHAYTAIRWEGPNLIGRPYKFKVVHILEVLDELRRDGRLKLKGKEKRKVTFHDPCQIVRRGGVVDQPRELMNLFAEDFVEMSDNGVLNWCCGGGGGVSRIERAHGVKTKAFNRKRKQLEEIGVKTMVTACANCRIVMEEGLEAYNMEDVEVLGLTETLVEYLDESAAADE